MMTNENQDCEKQDWQELARQASQETDPERLIELVRQLNSVLGKAAEERRGPSNVDSGLGSSLAPFSAF